MNRTQEQQDFLNALDRKHGPRRFSDTICLAATVIALTSLSACGGGDDSEDDHAEPPKPRVDCRVSGACL